MAIKLLANTVSFTTANTVNTAGFVSITTGAVATLVTQRDSANNVLGSIVLPPNTIVSIRKTASDTLEANNTISCTQVGSI